MSGSRDNFDFGMGQQAFPAQSARGTSVPSPADAARGLGGAPLPSDIADMSRKGRRRPRRLEQSPGRQPGQGPDRRPAQQPERSSGEPASELHADEKRIRRRKTAVISAVTIAATLVSLFVLTGQQSFADPVEVFSCYGLFFQNALAGITGSGAVLSPNELLAHDRYYFLIINRVPLTVLTLVCGGMLAIAGTLYQSAFRNPIASPSMLGVSSAIQLGDVILVMTLGIGAITAEGVRYLICYACIAVVLAVLFGCGRLMTGKGRPFNIVNLLLIATIINQIIGVLVTYITTFYFTFDEWEVFNAVSEALEVSFSPVSWAMLGLTCAVGLIPVFAMRFRMNALSFDDAEMRFMGVNAGRLRIVAVVCGTVLLMGAQVEMGTVAMVSLVVPHVSRMVFGAEFRKQFWGNVMMGAALLVLCRDIVNFVPYIGGLIPVSVVVNFVVLPFFVWMLATQQRTWGQ